MLYELRAIAQNLIMALPATSRLAETLHSTGMNGNLARAREMLDAYQRYSRIAGRDILELGPGQSPQVLQLARASGARRCVAIDTRLYDSARAARHTGIDVHTYDGIALPFGDSTFDAIWSSSVLEHVREPRALLTETFRVLRTGGRLVARIDLRDHYFIHDEERWLDCLKYSDRLWHLMTSNRTSFVNRLRCSDWESLFQTIGFKVVALERTRSPVALRAVEHGKIRPRRPLSPEDGVVVQILVACEKS